MALEKLQILGINNENYDQYDPKQCVSFAAFTMKARLAKTAFSTLRAVAPPVIKQRLPATGTAGA
ncbi:MAG: hypothetical protein KF835_13390 [Xanthobacteraceae bacterium]|nr:hypothetical protein [Xanthobacteraceae bacterium]